MQQDQKLEENDDFVKQIGALLYGTEGPPAPNKPSNAAATGHASERPTPLVKLTAKASIVHECPVETVVELEGGDTGDWDTDEAHDALYEHMKAEGKLYSNGNELDVEFSDYDVEVLNQDELDAWDDLYGESDEDEDGEDDAWPDPAEDDEDVF
jgi:hypothetical protein